MFNSTKIATKILQQSQYLVAETPYSSVVKLDPTMPNQYNVFMYKNDKIVSKLDINYWNSSYIGLVDNKMFYKIVKNKYGDCDDKLLKQILTKHAGCNLRVAIINHVVSATFDTKSLVNVFMWIKHIMFNLRKWYKPDWNNLCIDQDYKQYMISYDGDFEFKENQIANYTFAMSNTLEYTVPAKILSRIDSNHYIIQLLPVDHKLPNVGHHVIKITNNKESERLS